MSLKNLSKTANVLIGRKKNAFICEEDGNIVITTNVDIAAPVIIKLNPDTGEVLISGGTITVISKSNQNLPQQFSVVYGERLTEILLWMIQVLMTHSHGPNAPPIPDFFRKAQAYLQDLRQNWIENKNFSHK